jgi:hypothetical protein
MRYKTVISYQLSVISFILLICTVSLKADYANPPLWQNSADYTHQSWDFGYDEGGVEPVIPALPDGEPNWVNPFYNPTVHDYNGPRLTAVEYSSLMAWWEYFPMGGVSENRRGLYGGMADTALTFYVPDSGACEYWQRRLWVQMTYFARKDGEKNYDIQLARNSGFTDTQGITVVSEIVEDINETVGNTAKWYRFTGVYKFNDWPDQEYIKLTALQLPPSETLPTGGAAMVDQVDIDCRSVNVADLDENGVVDMMDFAFFANQWRQSGPGLAADFDKSLSVDFNDLEIFAGKWLSGL